MWTPHEHSGHIKTGILDQLTYNQLFRLGGYIVSYVEIDDFRIPCFILSPVSN
jgi:hypothetical protein